MEWLNYHHLLYFWTVAREGTVTKASEHLRLAQPTLSSQIRALEEAFGEKLFVRAGRRLVLTETGHLVYRYANEIFSLGLELTDTLKGRPAGRGTRLVIGITDVLPKLVACRLLEPALSLPDPVRIVCLEGKLDRLLAALAIQELDIILADDPCSPLTKVRAYNHLLGECGISFFAAQPLADSRRRKFPMSLNGAPFLFPTDNTSLRRSLDHWFNLQGIRPAVVGEFEDSALLKAFGEAGHGIFAMPTIIEAEIKRQYSVLVVGRTKAISERFYAISIERKLRHPAVVAITEKARHKLSR